MHWPCVVDHMLFTSLEVASLEDARRPILATQLLKLPGDGPGNPRPVHPDDQRLHGPVLLGTRKGRATNAIIKGKISGRLWATPRSPTCNERT